MTSLWLYIHVVKILLSYNSNKYFINCRLVSAYEDKALGLSDYGEVFDFVANLTFPKFVDKVLNQNPYIVHPTEDHEHWRPFYVHCNFCRIHYDVVGRMEYFEGYLKHILERTNTTDRLPESNMSRYHMHPSGHQSSSSGDAIKKKIKGHFSSLSKTQLAKLHDMYKIDFEMFGYDSNEYLN